MSREDLQQQESDAMLQIELPSSPPLAETCNDPRTSSPLRYLLLEGPNEIIVEILSKLHHRDFLALRCIDRAFHELIHKHETAVVKKYMQHYYTNHSPIYPCLLSDDDLSHVFEFSSRQDVSNKLSAILSDRIAEKITFRSQSTPGNDTETKSWRDRKSKILQRRLIPAIYTLHEFFLQLRTVFLAAAEDFEYLSKQEYLELGQVFELDQQYIIEKLPEALLMNITQAWQLLQGVCNAKGYPMNRRTRTYPFTSVRMMLAYGGLKELTEALNLGHLTTSERDTAFEAMNEVIWEPAQRIARRLKPLTSPLESIHHLEYARKPIVGPNPSLKRSAKDQARFVDSQILWSDAAYSVMQRKGIIVSGEDIPKIEPWIKEVIAEESDVRFDIGSWGQQDT